MTLTSLLYAQETKASSTPPSVPIVEHTVEKNKDASEIIEYIDLIHFCHTDYGFTDNPEIAMELHRAFLDIGIDAVLESVDNPDKAPFYWTAEITETVGTWWKNASPERRNDLLRALKSGRLEIAAMPFNLHPFYNKAQIDTLTHWLPEELWDTLKPEVGIQHDVNGFPRALAMNMMKKGVKHFWSGLNLHWGGIFHKPPFAFWWKMPNGDKALVWLGMPYWEGYLFFAPEQWRYAQRPASNTQFRTPRPEDMLKSDEESVRAAHAVCLRRLNAMIAEGYPYDFIAMSITNQYRCDNDGPFVALADFVATWNKLGLKPKINFTTATDSMKRMEQRIGDKIETLEGDWPDWWSFGLASEPRALAASRHANLFLEAAFSPAWGSAPPALIAQKDAMLRDLCLFYEHTFATWESNRDPFSLFNQAHLNTSLARAFRPYERAQWILAQRVRAKLTPEPEGLYAVNTGALPYTGWLTIDPAAFVRTPYISALDTQTRKTLPLEMINGEARLWVENLTPDTVYRYILSTKEAPIPDAEPIPSPDIVTNDKGWPTRIEWKGHNPADSALLDAPLAHFHSFNTTTGRTAIAQAWSEPDPDKRAQRIRENSEERDALYEDAQQTETSHTLIYTQRFTHPSLKYGVRTLEIRKDYPKVDINVEIDRLSNPDLEILYIDFPFPKNTVHPEASNGGIAFTPYTDQLKGTCTDFLAIDGWVRYPDAPTHTLDNSSAPSTSTSTPSPTNTLPTNNSQAPAQHKAWLWGARDTALVSFGGCQFGTKSPTPPKNVNLLSAMVYNNSWEVDFLNDCIGKMQFKFTLMREPASPDNTSTPVPNPSTDTPQDSSSFTSDALRTYLLTPVLFVNPATREDPHTYKHQHKIAPPDLDIP